MTKWRGIILAGGAGSRLFPLTKSISKQLLPIYDKPMIYYPLSVLMMGGITEIAIITAPNQQILFKDLLGDGSQWGCHFEYVSQPKPEGLAQAFLLCEDFIKGYNTCLVLGDNLFFGQRLKKLLTLAQKKEKGATVFGYHVTDPKRYGVIEFDKDKNVISIEEKPAVPKSSYALTGLYFFDQNVLQRAKEVKPSARGELEITDVIQPYLDNSELTVEVLDRGFAWLDTGTQESLLEAASFVHSIEARQGLMIGSPDEIALQQKFITPKQLEDLAKSKAKSTYGKYILHLAEKYGNRKNSH